MWTDQFGSLFAYSLLITWNTNPIFIIPLSSGIQASVDFTVIRIEIMYPEEQCFVGNEETEDQ